MNRDIMKTPYTPEEIRVVEWLQKMTNNEIGGGDDPIGWILASYSYLANERKELKLQIEALKEDNRRMANLLSFEVDKT